MAARSVLLAGKHVALVEMSSDDQPHFQQWLAHNPELRALIDDERVPTMDDQLRWFARVQQPDRRMFSLVTLPDETLIGNAGFVDIDPVAKTAVFRITIGNTGYHGKGLGTEATVLTLQYAFDEMDLHVITLEVLPTNERAIRMYENVGFTRVGEGESGKIRMKIEKHEFLERLP